MPDFHGWAEEGISLPLDLTALPTSRLTCKENLTSEVTEYMDDRKNESARIFWHLVETKLRLVCILPFYSRVSSCIHSNPNSNTQNGNSKTR